MAKQCKVIHIHGYSPIVVEQGEHGTIMEHDFAEMHLREYLREGWEVKHMVAGVAPVIQQEGAYSVCKNGFTFYLEREEITFPKTESDFEDYFLDPETIDAVIADYFDLVGVEDDS